MGDILETPYVINPWAFFVLMLFAGIGVMWTIAKAVDVVGDRVRETRTDRARDRSR